MHKASASQTILSLVWFIISSDFWDETQWHANTAKTNLDAAEYIASTSVQLSMSFHSCLGHSCDFLAGH